MKIAVTVEDETGLSGQVAQHFGRSPFFAFIEHDGQQVKSIDVVPNPFLDGHHHGQIPSFIHDHSVNVMISGGMGQGAVNFFKQFGIETAIGASGTVQQTLESYFNGELSDVASCGHHRHGQGHGDCSHH